MKRIPLMKATDPQAVVNPAEIKETFAELPNGEMQQVPLPLVRISHQVQIQVGLVGANGAVLSVAEYVAQLLAELDYWKEQAADLRSRVHKLEAARGTQGESAG